MNYLLDTNIIIFFFKGKFGIDEKIASIASIASGNCYISEITLAELKYGAFSSSNPEKHLRQINQFVEMVKVLPITAAIDQFAKEKARLRKDGKLIDDFDLLIGCTAIINELILVTNNTKHFTRLQDIELEDWTTN
ncbi:MAG: type II toxin-antitoxin system VapC family toxin [Bacteroidota bacterium]